MATTTRKKTSPRPAADQRPSPLVDLTEDAFDETAVRRLFLFELNGTDYYIPDSAPAGVLHETARLEREAGQSAAMRFLFGEFLGEDGVTALYGYKRLSQTQLLKLYKACVGVLTGPKA